MDGLDVPRDTLWQRDGAYSLNGVLEEGVDVRYIFRGQSAICSTFANSTRYWVVVLMDFNT